MRRDRSVGHRALFGAPDEPGEYRLDRADRQARLQTTVLAALQCVELVWAELDATPGLPAARQTLTDWLDRVDKIVADEV